MNLLHLGRLPHSITSRPRDHNLIFFGLQITYLVNVSQCNGVEPVTEPLKCMVTHICVCVCACESFTVFTKKYLNTHTHTRGDHKMPHSVKRDESICFKTFFVVLWLTVPCRRWGTQRTCGFSPGSSGSGHSVSGQGKCLVLMWPSFLVKRTLRTVIFCLPVCAMRF